ncbi:NAD(P)-dependent oxidoreductase [Nocardioides korecus]
MKILVAGATGVAGRALVPHLLGIGHDVTGLARSDQAAAVVERMGATAVRGDVLDREAVQSAAEGVDAIVHLATAIPADPTAPGAWDRNDEIRIDGTANLCAAASRAGVRHLVAESVHYLYGDHGDDWVDEPTPLSTTLPPMLVSAAVLEQTVAALEGVEHMTLRFGQFYGAGTQSDDLLAHAATGTIVLPGDGTRWLSLIHPRDAAQAVELALSTTEPNAVWNVSDGIPVREIAFAHAAAAATHTDVDISTDPGAPVFGGSLRLATDALTAAGFVPAVHSHAIGLRATDPRT